MKINDIEKLVSDIDGDIFFNHDLKKLNWFNIGGKAEIFFKPNTLKSLIEFLNIYLKRGKIFILGAGSNVLIKDAIFPGVIIKLGRNFSNISILNENLIIAGCATSQKNLSEYAKENNLGEMEFLSCIPGSVGGGIRMNSGCFEKEFKDIILSVQAVDKFGKVLTIPLKSIYCTETKIFLNSFSKHPEFILIPPPTDPGIHDKNSISPRLFSFAYSDKFF